MTIQELNNYIANKIAKLQNGKQIQFIADADKEIDKDRFLSTKYDATGKVIARKVFPLTAHHPSDQRFLKENGSYTYYHDETNRDYLLPFPVIELGGVKVLIPGVKKPKITADDPAVQKLVQEKLTAKGYIYGPYQRKIVVLSPEDKGIVDTPESAKIPAKSETTPTSKSNSKKPTVGKAIISKPNEFPSSISLEDAFKIAQEKGFKSFKWDGLYYITELGAETFTKPKDKVPTIEQLSPKPRELPIIDEDSNLIESQSPKAEAPFRSLRSPRIELEPITRTSSLPLKLQTNASPQINPIKLNDRLIPQINLDEPQISKVPVLDPFQLKLAVPTITKVKNSPLVKESAVLAPQVIPQKGNQQPKIAVDTNQKAKSDTSTKVNAVLYPPVKVDSTANHLADSLNNVLSLRFKKSFIQSPNIRSDTSASFLTGRGLINEKKAIILHHTGEYSDRQNKNTFLNSKTSDPRSTHVYIKTNGDQEHYATADQVAFHAGKSEIEGRENVNDFSLGIEFAGDTNKKPLTQQQLESAAQYIIPKMLAYKIPIDRLYSHQDVSGGRKADISSTQKAILKQYIWNKIQSDSSLLNMYIKLGLHLPTQQLSHNENSKISKRR